MLGSQIAILVKNTIFFRISIFRELQRILACSMHQNMIPSDRVARKSYPDHCLTVCLTLMTQFQSLGFVPAHLNISPHICVLFESRSNKHTSTLAPEKEAISYNASG